MYTVCMSISCNEGFLGDDGKFYLEFPNAAQFKTSTKAIKAIKHHNKAKNLEEFTTFRVVENYGLENEKVQELKDTALEVFQVLDYYDDLGNLFVNNVKLALKVQKMQDKIKHLEELVSKYESDD